MTEIPELTAKVVEETDRYAATMLAERYGVSRKALVAIELAKFIVGRGMVPTKEVTGGVQIMRTMTHGDVATLAVDITESLYEQFAERGWIIDMPEIDTLRRDRGAAGFGAPRMPGDSEGMGK